MKLMSVAGHYHKHLDSIGFRFHKGAGNLNNTYGLLAKEDQAQRLYRLIQSALYGKDESGLFKETSAELADYAGTTWIIKRRKDRVAVLQNDKPSQIKVQDLLDELVESEDPSTLLSHASLGRYNLTKHQGNFVVAPLTKQSEEEKKLINLISKQCEAIFDACKHSLQDPDLHELESLEKALTKLEPIFNKFNETNEQYKDLFDHKETKPRQTQIEIDDLNVKIGILCKISQVTQDIVGASPSLESLKLKAKVTQGKIQKNLDFCQLDRLPVRPLPPDWNIALQCLCYLNALDKLIPLVSQSAVQYKKHLKESLNLQKADEAEFFKEKNRLLSQLKKSREFLNQKNSKFNDGRAVSLSHHESIFDKLSVSRAKERAKHEVYQQFSEIQANLDNVILSLHNIKGQKELPSSCPKNLEGFLKQSFLKRDNLKKHWEGICREFKIDIDISLHDFLQFILRYNELFILRQQSGELSKEVKARGTKINHLRVLLQQWYETTGSQKGINLDNPQIVLSEAKNVIRYLSEKEDKLKEINKNRLEIEVKLKLELQLRERLSRCQEQWKAALVSGGLNSSLGICDPRIPPLLEKSSLLKSLVLLKHHVSSLNVFPASSRDWTYEAVCLWHISCKNLSDVERKKLAETLSNLPELAHHLLFFVDGDLANEMKRVGMGQVTNFKPKQAESIGAGAKQLSTPPEKARSHLSDKTRSQPNQTAGKEILSPQVQAVLDLLNGAPGR